MLGCMIANETGGWCCGNLGSLRGQRLPGCATSPVPACQLLSDLLTDELCCADPVLTLSNEDGVLFVHSKAPVSACAIARSSILKTLQKTPSATATLPFDRGVFDAWMEETCAADTKREWREDLALLQVRLMPSQWHCHRCCCTARCILPPRFVGQRCCVLLPLGHIAEQASVVTGCKIALPLCRWQISWRTQP